MKCAPHKKQNRDCPSSGMVLLTSPSQALQQPSYTESLTVKHVLQMLKTELLLSSVARVPMVSLGPVKA